VPQLVEEQEPGICRQELRDADGRGVGTMRRPEGVVHVQLASLREVAGEAWVVLRLARREARVLEDGHPVIGQELAQARPHGLHRVLHAVLVGLRPAEVGADAHLVRTPLEQQLERGQRSADPRVVGDPAALERDVQVRPDEDDLAADVRILDRAGQAHSTRPTRSTRRQL
jgi:hypothetical protein